MELNFAQIIISILLFVILFFGISFITNMLLKTSWIVAVIYPIIVILIVDTVGVGEYFTHFIDAISSLVNDFAALQTVDVIILSAGFLGTIAAGVVIKILRSRGYNMF